MNSRDMNNVVTSSGAPLPVGVHYPEAPHQQQQHGGHHSHGGSKHTTASGNTTALTPTSSTNSRGDMSVAPGVRKQFLRTKLCKHFLRGCCLYGDKCTYAHDYSQIQVRPDLRKTRMCQANLEGRCPYRAEDCQFAHSTEDLKATPGLFKTVLCSWWQKGKCDMGDKCRFAHGEEELQRPSAPSGPENISITPGSTPLQSPSLVEEKEVSSRSATPPGLDNVTSVSVMQRPRTSDTNNRSVPQGLQRNVFTPPPEIAISPAEVLKYQQNQFASVLSGSLAAAAQAAAMQQRPTQDPTAYAAQQQQQWAIAAAAATAATAAVASIAGAFEPTPAQLQNLSLIAARSLHQQAAMQQM
ncbi:conserved hypothetical protein [Perkinsus marinus ATCC 50983]|uniref:C3H1-type domain-containing protein n=1 Tax=Perkinsus marinus (strain ATCC 50983 / TXsc) TaxID=423536 RepID=C5KNI5_PERM5|nr:conserved hypothetical protein [Perkinsus marinus ATCC 50983]EER14000.1 conserved hypothetical protein [Perkinsus marinus ATCC 50983]|eukprot:XP_002782205.1 conserved hypothetical protein [Perkinsus marinus ATCC 50983]